MSETDLHTEDKSWQTFKDQIADAGQEAKLRAGEAFRASADPARERFWEAADAASDAASEAADKFQEQTRRQQHAGADFVDRFAKNIREASRAFEGDSPFTARSIDSAADYVEEAADKIRDGTLGDIVAGARDFARRQPTAFLGLSVLAGFAVIRLLKASDEDRSTEDDRP
jgi:FAD/FMN-containing dehydrogenase